MYFNNETVLYLDGKFVKASESTTDLYGQTLHYGYGAFEGIRSYETEHGTKVFKAEEHYERLKKSCELVKIPFDYKVQELVEATYELLEKNNLKNAYIRPLVYCAPNMSLTKPTSVSLMIAVWDWGAYLGEKLLRLTVSSYCLLVGCEIRSWRGHCGPCQNHLKFTRRSRQQQPANCSSRSLAQRHRWHPPRCIDWRSAFQPHRGCRRG